MTRRWKNHGTRALESRAREVYHLRRLLRLMCRAVEVEMGPGSMTADGGCPVEVANWWKAQVRRTPSVREIDPFETISEF